MALKTRLDGRSEENNRLAIKNSDDKVIAIIKMSDQVSTTLSIETKEGFHIEKANGWSSKR